MTENLQEKAPVKQPIPAPPKKRSDIVNQILIHGGQCIAYVGLFIALGYSESRCKTETKASFAVTSISGCVQISGLSEKQCTLQSQQAQAAHAMSGPRYADQTACEAEFGIDRCRSENSAESAMDKTGLETLPTVLYVPEPVGFLVGIHRRYNVPLSAQPIYPSAVHDNSEPPRFRTMDGIHIAALDTSVPLTKCYYWPSGGSVSFSSSGGTSKPVNAQSVVTRRGGFGATGRAVGRMGG